MVYDIGVSAQWSACYRQWFKHTQYTTIDVNPEKNPDVLYDVESNAGWPGMKLCDVLICNGVTEQCNDVAALLRGCHSICKGTALFGCAALGYPMYGRNDRFRFTPHGLVAYLDRAGFKEIKHIEFQNTYLFATCSA